MVRRVGGAVGPVHLRVSKIRRERLARSLIFPCTVQIRQFEHFFLQIEVVEVGNLLGPRNTWYELVVRQKRSSVYSCSG